MGKLQPTTPRSLHPKPQKTRYGEHSSTLQATKTNETLEDETASNSFNKCQKHVNFYGKPNFDMDIEGRNEP